MKGATEKYGRLAVMLLFGVAVFAFWSLLHPSALAWQEQFQLFLFDKHYLMERLSVSGGVAAYLSEFFVQFYNNPLSGGVVLALLYLLLCALTEKLMRQEAGVTENHLDLLFAGSFVPVLLLGYAMGDESLLLAYPFSLLIVLALMAACPAGKVQRWIYSLVVIPLTYWIAGPMVFLLALYLCVKEVQRADSWLTGAGIGILQCLYALLCLLLSARIEPYSLSRLAVGVFYYRLPETLPASVVVVAASCLLLVWLAPKLNRISANSKYGKKVTIVAGVVLLAAMVWAVPSGYDTRKYELIKYDYLVRTQQWKAIIEEAEKQHPDLPMSVCATNLALGMTNQLGERAFDFFQKGSEGLFPTFERDFNSTMLTGEAYFQLGLVNTAQRYAFEAMEAIPDYRKSGRVMKRLAETNLINGDYKVAEKYLQLLEKTIFYRKWAQGRLQMVADTTAIERHPLYGRLRKMRLESDFLFSEPEMDKVCGQLLVRNKDNKLAMQYLLLHPLLNHDLQTFMQYYSYVNSLVRYNPTVCQEAVAFVCMKQKVQAPADVVSNDVSQRFKGFAQTYTFSGKDSQQMEAYRNTVWYYLIKD